MNKKLTTDYVADFNRELESIDKLEETPKIIIKQAVQALDTILTNSNNLVFTDKNILENTKQALENISESSIKNNFKIIYSQMCVLAVSSLEATLKKYFENSLNNLENINKENKRLKESKISFYELVENKLKFSGQFGKLVVEKNKPNFQDLKSIKSVFKDYMAKEIILKEEMEKKICFYLEARHVLVHRGGIVDEKFISATESFNANIKDYKEDDPIEIDEADWSSMKIVLGELVSQVTRQNKK